MAEEKEDWLFPNAKQEREDQQENALVFAQKYLVFFGPTSDPRARDLLEHWTMVARRKRLPDNASLGELAANNAFCRFIEGIHAEIERAMKGAQSLPPKKSRTT